MSSESQRILELEADLLEANACWEQCKAKLADYKNTISWLRSKLSDLHYSTHQCSGYNCYVVSHCDDMHDCQSCGECFCDACWSCCEYCEDRFCDECIGEHKDKCQSIDAKSEDDA